MRFYPIMVSVLGFIFLDGINIGIQTATILRLIPMTDDEQNDKIRVGIMIIVKGTGCLIGGYLGAFICDKMRIKRVIFLSIILYSISCALIWAGSFVENYYFTLGIGLFFGIQYYFISSCEMVVCSRLFEGKPESFAVVKQFHSVSFVIY